MPVGSIPRMGVLGPNPDRGKRLRDARDAAKLTQSKVAHTLGVDKSTVFRWESGDNLPAAAELEAVAKLYGVTELWILFGSNFDSVEPVSADWFEFLEWVRNGPNSDSVEAWMIDAASAMRLRLPPGMAAELETYKRFLFALESIHPAQSG